MSNGWGGRINYTYSRSEGQPVRRVELLLQRATEMQDVDHPRTSATVSTPSTASTSWTCRTRSCHRRSSSCRSAKARSGSRAGIGASHPRQLDHLVDHRHRERLPDHRFATAPITTEPLGGFNRIAVRQPRHRPWSNHRHLLRAHRAAIGSGCLAGRVRHRQLLARPRRLTLQAAVQLRSARCHAQGTPAQPAPQQLGLLGGRRKST